VVATRLHRNADDVSVADIIGAVEDTPQIAKVRAPSARQDMTQDLWDSVNAKVFDLMQSVTLRSLVLEKLAKGVKVQQKAAPIRGVFKRTINHTYASRRLTRSSCLISIWLLGPKHKKNHRSRDR
jgi:Rrf2 family iron-sulfur cluster assembly transcriptional regulator